MAQKNLDEWVVVCKNRDCSYRYPIPAEWPLEWKLKKFRGVCGCGEDTYLPEIKKKIACPECGTLNYRVIPKYFIAQSGKLCRL
jgi:hypothetical protein